MLLQCKGNDIVGLYKIFRKFLVSGLLDPLVLGWDRRGLSDKKTQDRKFPALRCSEHTLDYFKTFSTAS